MPNIQIARGAVVFQASNGTNSFAYSFSNYTSGSYPENGSWISFSVINNASTFSDQVRNTSFGNGLDIFTDSMSQSSYLGMNMSTFQSFTLFLNFSWNSNGYYGVTADTLKLLAGNSPLFSLEFGPLVSFDTKMKNSSSTITLGPEPTPNAVTTLSLSYNSTQPYLAMLELKQQGSNITAFPISINIPAVSLSSLNLDIGGNYSNLTLFNLSEEKGSKPLMVSQATSTGLHNSVFSATGVYSPDTGANITPYLDSRVNSVIYYSISSRLVSYDFYNSSFVNLTLGLDNLSGGIEDGGTIFYWSTNGAISLVEVNTTTLSASHIQTGISMAGNVSAMFSGTYAFFYNLSGSIVRYDLVKNQIVAGSNVTSGSAGPYFRTLSMGLSGNHVNELAFSNSSREILFIEYNLSTLAIQSENVTAYSFLTGGINLTSSSSGASGREGIFKASDNTSQTYLAVSSGGVSPSPANHSFYRVLYLGFSYSLLNIGGRIYSLGVNGTLSYEGITAPSGKYRVSANWDISEITIVKSGQIDIYYSTSSIPLSNSGMKVAGNSVYLVRGTSYLNLTVETNLDYTLTMHLNGTSYTRHNNNSFMINSSRLPEGALPIQFTGTNIAGYTSELNSTLEVDNAIPSINLSSKNGSYISNSTIMTFSVTDKLPVSNITVEYLSNVLKFNGNNGTYDLRTGNLTGMLNLSFMVTDIFGLEFFFSFTYTVVGSNANSTMSIWTGEYLNTSMVNLSWSEVKNSTYYVVKLKSSSGTYNTTETNRWSVLNLPVGKDEVALYSHLIDNITVRVDEVNVTVIPYSPTLNISALPHGIYSFTGDSSNDSFHTVVSSNMTAKLSLTVSGPSGTTVFNSSGQDSLALGILQNSADFNANGIYTIMVKATSLSGTTSSDTFHIDVNNSIPLPPSLNGTVFYTRFPYADVGLKVIQDLNYSVELSHNGTQERFGVSRLRNISLSSGEGNYTLSVVAYSSSGNHNSSVVHIIYNNKGPTIGYSITRDVVYSNYTYLHYSISDTVPIRYAILNDNGTSRNLSLSASSVMIGFNHNGKENLSITVEDYCGNVNTTANVSVNVSYYIHIVSPSIHYTNSGSIWHFHVNGKGNGLSRANITWYVNGKEVSRGLNLNYSLGYGINTVAAVLKYQGKTTEVTRHVIVTGLIPFIAAPIIAAALVAYRKFGTNRDGEVIREIILNGMGKPVRDIVRTGKGRKVPAGVMKAHIKAMHRNGELLLESDPDGASYIMPSQSFNGRRNKP